MFFNFFKDGIRSLWATKHTEDTKNDSDLQIRTTLRELIVYSIFLLTLIIIAYGMSNNKSYILNNGLKKLFIDTPADPANSMSNFLGLNLPEDFFMYLEKVFVPGLYGNWESFYNKKWNSSFEGYGNVLYENKLLGVPRIRQVRVKNNSCIIPEDFSSQIKYCYAPYSQLSRETESFGLKKETGWVYHSEEKLGSKGLTGKVNSYDGGGYYVDLNTTSNDSLIVIKTLKDNLWVDRATRAIFIDFTLYNVNVNLFSVIKLVIEFPPTGGIIPSFLTRAAKLLRYNSVGDYVVLVAEMIFCVFIVYYIGEEILEIKKVGLVYFKEFWNVLDVIIIFISICVIAFNIYSYFEIKKIVENILVSSEGYIDFDHLSYWLLVFNGAASLMIFLSWIKIFKYVSFNKTMSQLSSTLGASSRDLGGFAIMFFIIFLAFAQLGYIMFGTQASDFNTYSNSIFTLFRLILGDFDFQALQQANRILGPAYFILYVFFVFFVLLNMFIAIINDTYTEIKSEMNKKPNEIELSKFFKKRVKNMMDKMKQRKKDIHIMEEVLQTAENKETNIDYDQWRIELKKKGFTDLEIEEVIKKYDSNNDESVCKAELDSMKRELEKNKKELEIANKEGKKEEEEEEEKEDEKEKILESKYLEVEKLIGKIYYKINIILKKFETIQQSRQSRLERSKAFFNTLTSENLSEELFEQNLKKFVEKEKEIWGKM